MELSPSSLQQPTLHISGPNSVVLPGPLTIPTSSTTLNSVFLTSTTTSLHKLLAKPEGCSSTNSLPSLLCHQLEQYQLQSHTDRHAVGSTCVPQLNTAQSYTSISSPTNGAPSYYYEDDLQAGIRVASVCTVMPHPSPVLDSPYHPSQVSQSSPISVSQTTPVLASHCPISKSCMPNSNPTIPSIHTIPNLPTNLSPSAMMISDNSTETPSLTRLLTPNYSKEEDIFNNPNYVKEDILTSAFNMTLLNDAGE